VLSVLNPRKYPTPPPSYRSISLLYAVGKLFDKILLTRALREVNERRQLHDEQSLGSYPVLALRCGWPAVLKESTGNLTVLLSCPCQKPSTPYWLKASFAGLLAYTSWLTWCEPYPLTFTAERSKSPSSQPHQHIAE
jgi:hypothetical protein